MYSKEPSHRDGSFESVPTACVLVEKQQQYVLITHSYMYNEVGLYHEIFPVFAIIFIILQFSMTICSTCFPVLKSSNHHNVDSVVIVMKMF